MKVLLVEDEAHVAASLKVGLRAEGFVVGHTPRVSSMAGANSVGLG